MTLPLVQANEMAAAFDPLLRDDPWIFYTDSYKYVTDLNEKQTEFRPTYEFTKGEIKKHRAVIASSLSFAEASKQKGDQTDGDDASP
jgi:hypothetical protein